MSDVEELSSGLSEVSSSGLKEFEVSYDNANATVIAVSQLLSYMQNHRDQMQYYVSR